MRRRAFIAALCGAAAWPLVSSHRCYSGPSGSALKEVGGHANV
jgi:hypothetical protein